MRRFAAITAAALALVGFTVFAVGAGSDGSGDGGGADYFVLLDNAFGLTKGADVKIAGVRAGEIADLDLDRETMRAKVGLKLDAAGFDELREDAFCETRPQSLIGEYFVDCRPGSERSPVRPKGSTLPVERTGSTVPVDLVNDLSRRPYRERFSIFLGELGAGLAARGSDLNETIRRLSPALRETDRVLRVLAEERRTIRDLYGNASKLVTTLDRRRGEVTRFIGEARDLQRVNASRTNELRGQFQRLPTFLDELAPTMRQLGDAATAQRPALADLRRAAPLLTRFLDDLGPFADQSKPAVRSLSEAARTARPAIEAARPNVRRLRRATATLPEWATNLRFILEHLDDPAFAIEKDRRSPRGGSGYTGLEALLRYFFRQGQNINIYDGDSHILKISAFVNQCAFYADAAMARRPDLQKCAALLGPSRPGVTSPDPTATGAPATRRAAARERREPDAGRPTEPAAKDVRRPDAPGAGAGAGPVPGAGAPAGPGAPTGPLGRIGEQVGGVLDQLLPGAGSQLRPSTTDTGLLDFLMGP